MHFFDFVVLAAVVAVILFVLISIGNKKGEGEQSSIELCNGDCMHCANFEKEQ